MGVRLKTYVNLSAWVIAAGALFACSGTGGGTGGRDGGGSSGSNSGGSGSGISSGSGVSSGSGTSGSSSGSGGSGASLAINSASSPAQVGGAPPTGSSLFVLVDLTLKNTGASAPISANFVLFSLETSDALVISASPKQPSGQCSPTVSVASGGQIECQVAFEVPAGQTATTLLYDDQHGDKASAAVPAIPMSAACETFQQWLSQPSITCAQCISQALASTCASSNDAYNSSCGSDSGPCSACGSSADFCSCESTCDNKACQALFEATTACVVSACSGSCP